MTNLLFVSVDCLRADHLGCYGYDRPTSPNVDTFAADDRTTRYRRSYSNCPGTRWAFQSLHTGVSSPRIDGLGIPDGYRPLAAHLRAAGYATGGFAVNGFISREYGYDTGFDRYYSVREASTSRSPLMRVGKRVYDLVDSSTLRQRVLEPAYLAVVSRGGGGDGTFTPEHTDTDTTDAAVEFIEERQAADRPHFTWVHMMDAHTPYGYWPEHLRAIRGDADVDHSINPGLEDRVVEGEPADPDVVDTYDACVRRTDAEIGRLLEAVDDDTTVVVTGDHGEEFGRFGGFHQASLYSSMTDVPILVRPADGTALADADTPVQHLDIPATLLAAAGADVPDHWEGDALGSAAAHERTEDWPVFFSLSHEETAVRAGRWKLMEEAGRRQLFDLVDGEGETTPSEDAERREELGGLLDGYQRLLRDERVGEGQGDLEEAHRDGELSPEIEENLEDLGYL